MGAVLSLYPNDTALRNAYNALNAVSPGYAEPAAFQADPSNSVVPLQP